jgi:hypothetical protein
MKSSLAVYGRQKPIVYLSDLPLPFTPTPKILILVTSFYFFNYRVVSVFSIKNVIISIGRLHWNGYPHNMIGLPRQHSSSSEDLERTQRKKTCLWTTSRSSNSNTRQMVCPLYHEAAQVNYLLNVVWHLKDVELVFMGSCRLHLFCFFATHKKAALP